MFPGKPMRFSLFLLLFSLQPNLCAQRAYKHGVDLFISGNLESATTTFSEYFSKNPRQPFVRNILGNFLIIEAKEALRMGKYYAAYKSLKKAEKIFPRKKELKSLSLLAEFDGIFSENHQTDWGNRLSVKKELSVVFDYIFADDILSRKRTKYIVHIVSEGETMSVLALRYYGDLNKWERIWKSNPRIRNPHRLEKNMKLIIPLQ